MIKAARLLHAILGPRFELISPSHVQPEVLQVAERMRQIVEERLGLPRIPVRWFRRAPFWWLRPWRMWGTIPMIPPHLRLRVRAPAAFLQAIGRARLFGVFIRSPAAIVLERPPRVTPAHLLLLVHIVAHEIRHAWQYRQGWDMTQTEEIEADADHFVFQEMASVINQGAGQQDPTGGVTQ